MLTRRPLSFFGQALNNTSEQSEVSLFYVVMRSFTSCYSLRSSKTSLIITLRNGQDDKFAKKNELRVNIYIIAKNNLSLR